MLTRRGKTFTRFGMIFIVLNFFLMVGLAIKNGGTAFPGGVRDASGAHYVIQHGKRVNFTAREFALSYYQALLTFASFPTFFIGILVLYATGDIRERQGADTEGDLS